MWSPSHSPPSADTLLANAHHARALASWISRFPGRAPPRKRRRHTDLDDFLVPDNASDPDSDSSSPSAASSSVILLAGPPASGKTAAVYAVARQLSHTVIEVWPGIGRRSARDLQVHVGDAALNHSLTAQTIILFEEVDILFPQDDSFWRGLASLAAKTRRPIVLTCQDPSLVPPSIQLSSTLHFTAPSLAHVTRCLRDIFLHHFSDDIIAAAQPDSPHLLARLQLSSSSPDIRQALSQIQLIARDPPSLCPPSFSATNTSLPDSSSPLPCSTPHDLASARRVSEYRSFHDAHLTPRLWMQTLDSHDIPHSDSDTELGYNFLSNPIPNPPWNTLFCNSKCDSIAHDFAALTRIDESHDFRFILNTLETATLWHSLSPILSNDIDLPLVTPSFQKLFTEYVPFMRAIILAEDKTNLALLVDPHPPSSLHSSSLRPLRPSSRITRSTSSAGPTSKFCTFNTMEWLRQTRMTEPEAEVLNDQQTQTQMHTHEDQHEEKL